MKQDGYALVLSGGGTKGIYHIGAWKALREMKIKIDAVIGTSVGALVAGFMAQNDFEKAEKALVNIGIEKVISLPEEFVKDGQFVITGRNITQIRKMRKTFTNDKGLDTAPLKNFIRTHLDEKKIRQSGIDLGIVTYKLNKLEPVEIFLEDIEEGLLPDYILASATFPGFTATKIKKDSYIDGGVFNNIPFSTAKERGYKNIIVADISGVGFNREIDITGTDTVYIKNSIDMGWLLDFNKKFLSDFSELGYLDTLKAFGRINGIDYFYADDNHSLLENLEKTLFAMKSKELFASFFNKNMPDIDRNSAIRFTRQILPKHMSRQKDIVHCLAECAAHSLNIERIRLWNFSDFVRAIHDRYIEIEREVNGLICSLNKQTVAELIGQIGEIAKNADVKELFRSPVYKYERILEEILKDRKLKLPFANLIGFFPYLKGARVFFALLEGVTLPKKSGSPQEAI
jgi:NTE family protein